MILGIIFVMLAAFFVLMAGTFFIAHAKREQFSKGSIVVGWSAIVFSALVIVCLAIGSIVCMACNKGCGNRSGYGNHCPMKSGMKGRGCEGYSGATMSCGGMKSCGMSGGECGMSGGHHRMMMDVDVDEMHHGMGKKRIETIHKDGDTVKKEVKVIINK